MIKMNYEEIVRETEKLLQENNEWIERYKGFLRELQPQGRQYKAINHIYTKIRIVYPLAKYIAIGSAVGVKRTVKFDIRFLGCSIGELSINIGNKNIEEIDKQYINENTTFKFKLRGIKKVQDFFLDDALKKEFIESFGTVDEECSYNWYEKKGICEKLRSIASRAYKEKKLAIINEHAVETSLLKELGKNKGEYKKIKYIQPIRMCDRAFYQLTTPIKASKIVNNEITYSRKGGGIDILARRKCGNDSQLCVIEIKDEYKQSERPTEAIKQAIAYATFLIHLIRKANTEEYHWYKDIFGVNNQMENSIVVDAVIAMPYKTGIDNWDAMPEQDKKLCEIPRLKVGKDFIQLHSIFFEKEIYTEAQGFAVKGLEASFNKNH